MKNRYQCKIKKQYSGGTVCEGRNLLQCRQSLLRTEGWIVRSSPRGGGKGTARVIPSQGNRRYRDRNKKICLGESRVFQYCYCVKFTIGQRGQEGGPSEKKALYLSFLEVWTVSCRSQGKALWIGFPFQQDHKPPYPISHIRLLACCPLNIYFFKIVSDTSLSFHLISTSLIQIFINPCLPGLFHNSLTNPSVHFLLLTILHRITRATFLSIKFHSCSKTFSGFLWPES